VPSAGPSRNVLSVAARLAEHADVTVAFRDGAEGGPPGVRVLEIEPNRRSAHHDDLRDDAALRGVGYADFLRYMRSLRRFVDSTTGRFDIVLEKGWLLSGYASCRYRSASIPSIPVENLVQMKSSAGFANPVAGLRHRAGRHMAGRYLAAAERIIAETPSLRGAISACHGVARDRIEVIQLGVDPERFRPGDRNAARRELGIPETATVLLYAGILDRIHDLEPVIRGLNAAPTAILEVVGDGPLAARYRDLAVSVGVAGRVRFRGRVDYADLPVRIAAADLCLAPYDPSAFFGHEVSYSTLKIREFLASGRPVMSVRSGSIPDLVRNGETGFIVEHEREAWRAALSALPDRQVLAEMGIRAAADPVRDWEDVALDYLNVCESVAMMRAS